MEQVLGPSSAGNRPNTGLKSQKTNYNFDYIFYAKLSHFVCLQVLSFSLEACIKRCSRVVALRVLEHMWSYADVPIRSWPLAGI